jgi:predicted nucleotidyltransferase
MILNTMDIRQIVERVVTLCDPESVHLCGSYATGAAHAGSDLDLLIILPSTLPRLHRGKVIKNALSVFPCHFDLLLFTPQEVAEEMKDPYSFISAITASGRILYQKAQGYTDPGPP